jgi:hypothetical protein
MSDPELGVGIAGVVIGEVPEPVALALKVCATTLTVPLVSVLDGDPAGEVPPVVAGGAEGALVPPPPPHAASAWTAQIESIRANGRIRCVRAGMVEILLSAAGGVQAPVA